MRDQVVAEVAAWAEDQVENALRQTGLFEDLDQPHREERGI